MQKSKQTSRKLFNISYKPRAVVYKHPTKQNQSFPGDKYMDNGYKSLNISQLHTTRLNTATAYEHVAPRAVDSTPLLADMGTIYYNPVGISYSVNGSDDDRVININQPMKQIEIACSNINTYLSAEMYTDLPIRTMTPKVNFAGVVASSIYPRFLYAMIFNTKVLFSVICKFRRMISLAQYYAGLNEYLFSRSDLFLREVQRAKMRNAWGSLAVAVKTLPLHKQIVDAYSQMFNINVDNKDAFQSTAAYVTPSIYLFKDETFTNVTHLTNTGTGSLVFNTSVVDGLAKLTHDVDELTDKMFSASADQFSTWCTTVVDNFSRTFNAIASGIAAIAYRYEPFLTAVLKAPQFFNDKISSKFDINTLDRDYVVESQELYLLNFSKVAKYTAGTGALNRVVSCSIPLFNSLDPAPMFQTNALLYNYNPYNDNYDSYRPLMDITDLRLKRLWYIHSNLDTNPKFYQTTSKASALDNVSLHVIDVGEGNNMPSNNPENSNDIITYMTSIDRGITLYLQSHFLEWTYNNVKHIRPELTGARTISFTPVDDKIILNAPIALGINGSTNY